MFFWVIFDFVIFVLCISCLVAENRTVKRIFVCALYAILFFISAFRYNIGGDYSSYVDMFYNVSIYDENIYPEISYRILAEFFRGINIGAQFSLLSILL